VTVGLRCNSANRLNGNSLVSDVRFEAPRFRLFTYLENQNMAATDASGKDLFQPNRDGGSAAKAVFEDAHSI
jgi:hypothetical protein